MGKVTLFISFAIFDVDFVFAKTYEFVLKSTRYCLLV